MNIPHQFNQQISNYAAGFPKGLKSVTATKLASSTAPMCAAWSFWIGLSTRLRAASLAVGDAWFDGLRTFHISPISPCS